jgi:hypothetical protein
VAVGIGSLSYDQKYVDIGEPMAHFKGEMKILAKTETEMHTTALVIERRTDHL